MADKTIVLVTGGSHGIGLEVCRQLAEEGMQVILTARDVEKGEAAAKSIASKKRDVVFRQLDVSKKTQVNKMARQIDKEFGRLDVLVNNAAGYTDWSETASGADLKKTHDVLEITLFGAWRTIQAFLPLLRKNEHGRIVNVSSGAGSHDDPQFGLKATKGMAPSYGVSKAALNALTTKFAMEVEESKILVNAVCPGLTATYPGAEDMGARPVKDGAASVVWAVTLPDDGPTGGFFRDGKPLPW